jgi:hypothetical protein
MTEISKTIPDNILTNIYQEFVGFLEIIAGEKFISFKESNYLDEQENYKYSIYQEAKRNLRSKDWTLDDIGTGKIQKAVDSAILRNVIHNYKPEKNNLIYWMQKDSFSKLSKDKNLEQLFFDFYKNKINNQSAFEGLTKYFDYQLIAYLFFIKDSQQFLPISQRVFDKVIANQLQTEDFKTSGQSSWENYKTFIEIIKQVHRFLRTKDKNVTLLDAHSFLWILGKQRADWLENQQRLRTKINTEDASINNSSTNSQNTEKPKQSLHFLQYWLPLQVEQDKAFGGNLRHAGSNQFKRRNVKEGDTVWVITVKSDGQLYLVGRMVVDYFINHETALGMFDNEVIDRNWHIVVNEENSEPFKDINLMDVIDEIKFNSEDSEKLKVVDGKIDPRQLQTIRELTSESVSLIVSKWKNEDGITTQYLEDTDRDEILAEEKEEENIKQQSIPETEKEQLIKARRGQGKFRAKLELVEKGCRLTGVTDGRFLIASHIKAWKDSSNEEKLDGNNGLLLSPHVDKLFDKGWISFTDEGEILCADDEVEELMKTWGLDSEKSVGDFNEKQKFYLAYHREKTFRISENS